MVETRPYSNFRWALQLDSILASTVAGTRMARYLPLKPYSSYSYGLFSSRYSSPSAHFTAKSC